MALDWKAAVRALVGIPALSPEKPAYGKSLDDSEIESARRRMGGQLATLPVTTTRFYLEDWESAILTADGGDLTAAGALWSACRGDGVFAGVLSTREGGVVNLPKQFRGPDEYRKVLEPSDDDATSIFDAMMPLSELELIAGDGDGMGVGVGELCPVSGRDYPVLTRHDPALLRYVWTEDRWYFRSVAGLLPISPGDGRWVLHIPGGRIAPWKNGFWRAVTKSYILKTHAESYKANWEAKLANAARAAYSPIGASEDQRTRFLDKVIAWGLNTVFQLPPGWDVKLIEGKGEGHVSYEATIERSDHEFMIQVAGQVVTTTGGTGFVNGDMSQRIEDVLIQKTAKALAYTINTQILPRFLVTRWGVEALRKPLVMSYVVPTKDLAGAAAALTATGGAIKVLGDALLPYGKGLDVNEIGTRFGVPFDAAYEPPAVERVALQLAPTDIAKVVTTDEARASQGLGPIGDERGDLTVSELEAQATGGDDEGGDGDDEGGDGGGEGGGDEGEGGDRGGEVATDDGINDVEADDGIGASGPDAKTDSAVREKHFEPTIYRFHAGRWEYLNAAGNWDEDKHPRKKGEFAPKGGGDSGAKDKPGKEKVPAKKATPAQKKKAADVHKKATAKHREAHSAHKKAAREHETAKKKAYAAEVAVAKTKAALEKAAEAKKNAKTPAQKAKAAARHKAALAANKAAIVKHRAAVAAHKAAERKRKVAEKKAAAAKAAAEKAKAKRDALSKKAEPKPKPDKKKKPDPEPEKKPDPEPEKKPDPESSRPKEHTPEHWLDTYKHLGSVAGHAAWGHAMHERGLDLRPRDVVAALGHMTQGDGLSPEFYGALNRLKGLSATSKTIRQLVESGMDPRHVAMASLAAHALAMGNNRMEPVVQDNAGSPPEGLIEIKRATTFYATFAHKDLTFKDVYVNFDTKTPNMRGFFTSGKYQHPISRRWYKANEIEGSDSRRGVLEHELAHCLEENNEAVGHAARAFLRARTAGEKLENLADIYPGQYKREDGEMSRKDKFLDAYMGKSYTTASEIMSMGVEWMATKPSVLLQGDPEMFHFVLGNLAHAQRDAIAKQKGSK